MNKIDKRRGFKPEISHRVKLTWGKRKEIENRYWELIYAVERAFPNESRHETALRYIKETELSAKSQPNQSSGLP